MSILSYYGIAEASQELAAQTGQDRDTITQSMLKQAETGTLSVSYHLAGPNKDAARRQALSSTIGFALVFIMILVFSVMGTILEDKKRLTLARMSVSPVQRWEVIPHELGREIVFYVFDFWLMILYYVWEESWDRLLEEAEKSGNGVDKAGLIANFRHKLSLAGYEEI